MAVVWSRVAWAGATPYAIGARVTNASVVVNGVALPCVYECAAPGTSGGGPGPTGTDPSSPIVDGGVTWRYKGPFGGEVVALAPQLASLPAAQQNILLDVTDGMVSEEYFGAQSDAARLYLAAHIATMALSTGKGALTDESLGPMARSYQIAPGVNGHLALTSYGSVFKSMQLATAAGMGFCA